MKYDFWLELPMILISLLNFDIFENEHNYAKLLSNASKVRILLTIYHRNIKKLWTN